MNYRSFIALEAPEALRRSLTERLRLWRAQRGVKWVEDQNLHLTLVFLGDVESDRIPEVEALLEEHLAGCAPFRLEPRGVEIFPAREPRLIWCSLSSADERLQRLHRELVSSLRRTGFAPDAKPLKLHITLGRIRQALPPALEREIMAGEIDTAARDFHTLTLYRSVLRPEGPLYHELRRFRLE